MHMGCYTLPMHDMWCLQTVTSLHYSTELAHLNISTSSLTVQQEQRTLWDHLRLINFTFSQNCALDINLYRRGLCYTARTVKPVGVCSNYGAPEQLRSVQLPCMGQFDHIEVMINGPSADMCAGGVVMYELLTGQLPFGSKQNPHRVLAADPRSSASDAHLDLICQEHAQWAEALKHGASHPMLDRIRSCSASPDDAVDFFTKIFHPCHQCRLHADACFHPYMKGVISNMISDKSDNELLASGNVNSRPVAIPVEGHFPKFCPHAQRTPHPHTAAAGAPVAAQFEDSLNAVLDANAAKLEILAEELAALQYSNTVGSHAAVDSGMQRQDADTEDEQPVAGREARTGCMPSATPDSSAPRRRGWPGGLLAGLAQKGFRGAKRLFKGPSAPVQAQPSSSGQHGAVRSSAHQISETNFRLRSDVGLKSILELKQALSEPSPRHCPTQSLAALLSQNAKQEPQSFELDFFEDSLEVADSSPAEQTHAFDTSLSHMPITAQQPEAESTTNHSRNMVTTSSSPGSAAEVVVTDAVSPVLSLAHESASNAQAGSSVVHVTADSAVLHAADQIVASLSAATGVQMASMAATGLQSSTALDKQLTELRSGSSDEVSGNPCQVFEATLGTAGTDTHSISRGSRGKVGWSCRMSRWLVCVAAGVGGLLLQI